MILAVVCYTICSLSDKYAVSVGKMTGDELTFFMASCTALFMLPCLPFVDFRVMLSWQMVLAVILLAASKLFEFQMSAVILQEMTAFELKAWLGILIVLSYLIDVAGGQQFRAICLIFIALTILGLVLIALSEKQVPVSYKRIFFPLVLYLIARMGYGIVMKKADPYISSTPLLLFALVVLTFVLLPKVKPVTTFTTKKKASLVVILTKIPNVVGLLAENAVLAVSLANQSFISPMVLIALFFIGLLPTKQADGEARQRLAPKNLAGSLLCIVGIVGFQICLL